MSRWIVLVALSGIGCLPIPHREYDAPELSGTIVRDGTPVGAAKVVLDTSTGGSPLCAEPRESTATDPTGAFLLVRPGGWTPFMIFGDRMSTWTVCFEFPDGAQAHWRGSGWFGGPHHQRLTCRVNPVSKVNAIELTTARPGESAENSCMVTDDDPAHATGT